MKKLFSLVLTLLLFIGFTPINNAHAEAYSEEFQTTVSIPVYEDAEFLEYEEEPQSTEIETSEEPLTSVAPLLAKKKEIAKVNFGVNKSNLISYKVVMNKGYKFKSFSGAISTMDLTSGLSQGRKEISGQSGSVQIAKLDGHTFRSTLTGAVTTSTDYGYNLGGASIMWVYKK
ncbi:hypothetical protein PVA17_24040 [Lysinibacillus sp. CNPSo 3705]|uniref:hypothetical protein n=1 Tax=Lysinibacillus sp. CNPSo 3705 TaxID=3028148 RepID=UPI002363565C|nr:hypothetical protein [Lysinibacillus sp. CNPSo 3705]MDD1505792.1 hypothetical protein [Lysinibacillus sp. CNPSo 3705]